MQAQFVHDGKAVDFTPTVDVAVGSIVIQGDLVESLNATSRPARLARSLWKASLTFPKTLLAVEFEAGTKVYVDEDGAVVADDVGTTYLGKVVNDAAATDSFVRVRLSQ